LITTAVATLNLHYLGKNTSNEILLSESEAKQPELQANLTKLFAIPDGLINLTWDATRDITESNKQSILVATIFISTLLTPGAIPPDAMGVAGIPGNPFPNYGTINQNDVLFDHVAMLYPDDQMMNEVYKGELKDGAANQHIDYFGKWRPA
jgi:hypothetical protein